MAAIDLRDKPICITGASAGIGRATAMACASAGMPVMLTARREDRLEEAVREIRDAGGRAAFMAVDVADAEACRRMIDATIESFGSIHAVFANAGYGLEAPVHEMADEQMRDIFEVNFFGTMNTIRPALPHMIEAGRGHVVLCSSCLAKMSIPYYSAYSATKAAQHHIGRAMRLELASHGVHVSTVHPIGTRTEFFDVTKNRSNSSLLVQHSPDVFMQSPERVARAVVRSLRRPRPEVWTSYPVWWGMALAGIAPRLTDLILHRMIRRRMKNGEAMRTAGAEGAGSSRSAS